MNYLFLFVYLLISNKILYLSKNLSKKNNLKIKKHFLHILKMLYITFYLSKNISAKMKQKNQQKRVNIEMK